MDEIKETLYKELNNLLSNKRYHAFMTKIDELNSVDSAEYLATLDDENLVTAFRMLKKDTAVDIFAELDTELQSRILTTATDKELSVIMNDLYIDDAVDVLEELPAGMVKRIVKLAKPEDRALINKFLAYPEDSAGSIMTAEYIDLRKDMTAEEAITSIRKTGVDKETIYTAYVIDNSRILEGTVSLKDLIFASADTKIEDIMETNIVSANTLDDQETVASIIKKYDLLVLPIVDKEKRLVGIVTVDDAIDVMEDEVTEDIEKMAAIMPSDKSYMKSSIFEIWKKRIPWLLLLMVSATFTGQIITRFEGKLSAIPALVAFIPMLMDTGGNSGGQSSVTVIRGLALNEIEFKDIFKIIWKEIRVAVFCGITLSICNFAKIILVDNLIFHNNVAPMTALAVCLTLLATVIVAKIVGSTLPLFAKKLGFDPAVMASPFITTIVDAISLVLYFVIATAILL